MRFAGTRPINGDTRERRVFLWWPKTQWSDSGTGYIRRWFEWAVVHETYGDDWEGFGSWHFDYFVDYPPRA